MCERPTDRTLSMMEYEDWRSPRELAIAAIREANSKLYAQGLQNLYPQVSMNQGIGNSVWAELFGDSYSQGAGQADLFR